MPNAAPEVMVDFGGVLVFPLDIVAVERGEWSDEEQDFIAILVSSGGARIKTRWYVKTAKVELETFRVLSKNG